MESRIKFRTRTVTAPIWSLEEVLVAIDSSQATLVLDLRGAKEHDAWSIPGSQVLDADDAEAIAALPFDKKLILVCRAGRIAPKVADKLRASGRQVGSLKGGMKAWQGAWTIAQRRYHGLDVMQIRRPSDGALSYIISRDGDGVVVDPCVDSSVYVKQAKQMRTRVQAVIDTAEREDGSSGPLANDLNVPLLGQKPGDRVHLGGHIVKLGATSCIDLGEVILTGDSLHLKPDDSEKAADAVLDGLAGLDAKVPVLPGRSDVAPGFDGDVIGAPLRQVRAWHGR